MRASTGEGTLGPNLPNGQSQNFMRVGAASQYWEKLHNKSSYGPAVCDDNKKTLGDSEGFQ